MAKRKSEARKFGRDVGVIVVAGLVSGVLALVYLSRKRTRANNGNGELLTPEEIRDQLILQQAWEAQREMEESF